MHVICLFFGLLEKLVDKLFDSVQQNGLNATSTISLKTNITSNIVTTDTQVVTCQLTDSFTVSQDFTVTNDTSVISSSYNPNATIKIYATSKLPINRILTYNEN